MATSPVHAEISSLLYHFHRASDEYYEQTWNTWKTKTWSGTSFVKKNTLPLRQKDKQKKILDTKVFEISKIFVSLKLLHMEIKSCLMLVLNDREGCLLRNWFL